MNTKSTVRYLVAQSIAYRTTSCGSYEEETAKELLARCERDEETETRHTFWGVDADGFTWCVVLS